MLVIFDLDGTLIDTREEIEYTFRKAFENLGLRLDEKRLVENIGLAIEELIESLLGHYDPKVHEEIRKVYLGLQKRRIRVFPGMDELVMNGGFKKAIYTSKKRWVALRDLQYLGILHLFPIVIGADDVSRKKPHGEGIEKAIQLAGENKEHTFVVGDTEMDILAAKHVGVKSIAVTWGFRDESFLIRFKPDYLARTPQDILKIIGRESYF